MKTEKMSDVIKELKRNVNEGKIGQFSNLEVIQTIAAYST